MDAAVVRWRHQLDTRAFPMLTHWARHATNEQRLGAACIVYAHLAYFYRNTLENALDRRAVATIFTAQIFLNVHYSFDAEPDPLPPIGPDGKDGCTLRSAKRSEFVERHNAELGVAQTELCDVFARHRGGAIRWLENASVAARADVLEAIVRTITFTRSGDAPYDDEDAQSPPVAARRGTAMKTSQLVVRSWNTMALPGCTGRYIPDTEISQLAATAQPLSTEDFEQWLRRVTTTAVDTEINAQLGEFTLKKHAVRALDHRLRRLPDFIDVFGLPSTEQRTCGALSSSPLFFLRTCIFLGGSSALKFGTQRAAPGSGSLADAMTFSTGMRTLNESRR